MTAERTPGGFGSKLREARERRSITLRQIANTTKISISALEALERNDISRLPGGIFSRAFVRSYAIEVGLDPEESVQDFMAQFPHDSVTAGHPASAQIEDHEALASDRRMASTVLRLLVFSLPIAGVVLYIGTAGTQEPTSPPQAASGSTATRPSPRSENLSGRAADRPPPVAPLPDVSPATAAPVERVSPSDRFVVGLTVTGPCWVSAIVDGRRVLGREMRVGDREVLDVRSRLVLTAGNAGALRVTLNGAAARPLGKSGQVVTTEMTLVNFKDYLVER